MEGVGVEGELPAPGRTGEPLSHALLMDVCGEGAGLPRSGFCPMLGSSGA